MGNGQLLTLSDEQIKQAKINIENLDKIIRNGAALIDAGAMNQEEVEQAKATKEIVERTLKVFKPKI